MEGKPVRAYNITQCRRHCLLAQGEVILESKNCNHPGSHLRAVMALDHSRLGLENKFAENKSGRIFYVRQVYLVLGQIIVSNLNTKEHKLAS